MQAHRMSSWLLLQRLLGFWQVADNPIFQHATRRPPVWYAAYQRLIHTTGLLLALGGMLCYSITLLIFVFNNVLILFVPVLLAWTLIVGVTLGPVIAGERQNGTWSILRATPLALDTLLTGKASAALWWLRDAIRVLIGILWLVAIGIGLVSLAVNTVGSQSARDTVPAELMCVLAVALPVLTTLLYVGDRAQHFALTAAGTLAVSASARTARTAVVGGSAAAFALWLADAGIAAAVIALRPGPLNASWDHWLALLTLGPVAGYLAALPVGQALACVGVTLLLREGLFRALWRWTLRRAVSED